MCSFNTLMHVQCSDCSAMIVQEGQTTKEESLPTSRLLNTVTGNEKGVERVSTGTKFALEQWLHQKRK